MATAEVEKKVAAEPVAIGAKEPEVNKLFRMVMKHEGSDLHLKVGLPPMMRLKGVIRHMQMDPLTQEDMERLMFPILQHHHPPLAHRTRRKNNRCSVGGFTDPMECAQRT